MGINELKESMSGDYPMRCLTLVIVLLASSCNTTYQTTPPDQVPFLDRAQSKTRESVRVTVAVLSAEETELIFGMDRVDLIVHIEDLALLKVERLDDIVEGVCMDSLFESLPEEILSALGVGEMFVDCEGNIVSNETLSGAEEP